MPTSSIDLKWPEVRLSPTADGLLGLLQDCPVTATVTASLGPDWSKPLTTPVAPPSLQTCGNRQHEWIDVEFNDGMSSTAKRFP